MAKKKEEKVEAKALSMTFFCPKMNKQIVIEVAHLEWHASESECDMCGSHGGVSVYYKCECKQTHEIEVKSW